MQLRELYLSGKENMLKNSVENPGLESYLLLSKIKAASAMSEIYTHPEKELDKGTVDEFFKLLRRRADNEPAAYILGEKEFYSRRFKVNPSVLIPRPETELLAEEALKITRAIDFPQVLDLGTGSGCIAVTIACENPKAVVFAADISAEALKTARDNARELQTIDKIRFIRGDLLSPFKKNAFDVIVSNPPYVADSELDTLAREVRDYEPELSLLGGEDGLSFIKNIVNESPAVLKDGGWCVVEIGAGQAERVRELFYKRGFSEITALTDLGMTERVVKARWKK